MRILRPALTAMVIALPFGAAAQDNPVVLELFTSQGCVTCPPADLLLAELAQDKDVLALALHVTYWDYVGWRDTFGQPEFTKRQKAYFANMRQRFLFTPAMIIEGSEMVVGHDQESIAKLIDEHRASPVRVDIAASHSDGLLRLSLAPRGEPVGPTVIDLVRYAPEQQVEIDAGENAGRTITYTNIVTQWDRIGSWDGQTHAEVSIPLEAEGPMAVIVQEEGLGSILTAARLD